MSVSVRIIGMDWKWIANIEEAHWPEAGESLSDDSHIQILQMHNGVGKTTTLYLLQCLFTNEEPDSTTYARSRYKGPFEEARAGEPSEFSVDLKINNEHWIIGMKFQPREKTHSIYVVDPQGGRESDWNTLPKPFRLAFGGNSKFVASFLFDTQIAGARTESLPKDVVDSAILEITNLTVVDDLARRRLNRVYDKQMEEREGLDGTRVLAKTRNGIADLERYLQESHDASNETKTTAERNEKKLVSLKKELNELNDKARIKDKVERLEKEIDENRNHLKLKTKEFLSGYFDPVNLPSTFWESTQNYFANLDDLRIPEVIAKEVVDKIQEDLVCICGTVFEKGDDRYNHLDHYKESMAGADVVTEIFHIKESILSMASGHDAHSNKITEAAEYQKAIELGEQKMRQLTRNLEGDTKERIEALESRISDLTVELRDAEYAYKMINQSSNLPEIRNSGFAGNAFRNDLSLSQQPHDYRECMNIHVLNEALNMFKQKEAEIVGAQKYRKAFEVAKSGIGLVMSKLMTKLKEELLTQSNIYFPRLQTTGMRIHSFEDGMTLIDRNGQVQRGANTGGELSAQYSFLMGLRTLGAIDIPLVIDNPTKGLDGTAMRSFQSEIPELFDQVLLMIYPTEKLTLNSIIDRPNTAVCTFHRDDESVRGLKEDNLVGEGRMIINQDREWFVSYDPPEPRKEV